MCTTITYNYLPSTPFLDCCVKYGFTLFTTAVNKLLSSCAFSNAFMSRLVCVSFTTEQHLCTKYDHKKLPYLISRYCAEGNIHETFAKRDSVLSVLRPALSYRKTSLSPWFSDNCHILFKVEGLWRPDIEKTRGLTCIHTCAHTHKSCGKPWDDDRNICPRN